MPLILNKRTVRQNRTPKRRLNGELSPPRDDTHTKPQPHQRFVATTRQHAHQGAWASRSGHRAMGPVVYDPSFALTRARPNAKSPDISSGLSPEQLKQPACQKPNLAAVSFSVSAERFNAASSRSDTGVLIREFTP